MFSTGLICGTWGGSGMSGDVIGNAQRPCAVPARPVRRGGLGAFGTDGAKDAGPFASGPAPGPDTGEGALPSDTRFVPAPHLDFLAAHRIGQVGLYLGGKVSKRLPGLRVGFRAGAPKGAETRARQTACRAFLHRHTQAPFDLALQTDTPPADNTVRFRTGACADERGLPRRVEAWVTPRRPASSSRPSSL